MPWDTDCQHLVAYSDSTAVRTPCDVDVRPVSRYLLRCFTYNTHEYIHPGINQVSGVVHRM